MADVFQPTVLFFLCIVVTLVVTLGAVAFIGLRKMRERELQYHQDLRIREMEHQVRMKQLEIELAKAQGSPSRNAAA